MKTSKVLTRRVPVSFFDAETSFKQWDDFLNREIAKGSQLLSIYTTNNQVCATFLTTVEIEPEVVSTDSIPT